MHTRTVAPLLLAASMLASMPALAKSKAPTRLHVNVSEKDGGKVAIDVPISVARAAVTLSGEGNVDMDAEERVKVKTAWEEIKRSKEPVTIDADDSDSTVHVRLTGDKVEIDATDKSKGGESVKIRLPADAVDALLEGDEGLDLAGALQKLSTQNAGDLVTVTGDDGSVRIWLD